MNRQTLPLEKIQIGGGTQSRAALNEEVVAEYAETIKAGTDMPPVTVFQDGRKFWLADGFHRFHAHRKAGAIQIEADVRVGTKRDAILHSVGANAAHGLRRSNADKRAAVKTLLDDKEWSSWSDRRIADTCGLSISFVSAVRNPEVADRQRANRDASAARRLESDSTPTSPAGAAEPSPSTLVDAPSTSPATALPPASNDDAKPVAPPPSLSDTDTPPDDDGAPHDEMEGEESELDSLRQQVVELTDILAGFDAVAAGEKEAAAEITRLTGQLRVVESQRDQWMTTCSEIKNQVKALQRENARLLALVPKEVA